ncbi:MAG: hypothetical protein ACFFD8_01165 [Candidatus Thorarchaeota archaeon]
MRLSAVTKCALVFTVTVSFIGICLILSPPSNLKVEGTALSSSGICISKQFKYAWLMDGIEWQDKDMYLTGLDVTVYYMDCWMEIGTFTTNDTGWIEFCGVPAGWYKFKWECGGVWFESKHYACCNMQHHVWVNEIEPKGEERATSSFILRGISYLKLIR